IIFKSNDLAILPKKTLITLLKSDELSMDEDDILMSVVQWATKQEPELELGDDPNDWSSDDINTVKGSISDCILHVRFSSMSFKKVIQYNALLPEKLRYDVLNYHMDKDYQPNTCMLPPRIGKDINSVIINEKQAVWISSKIVESTSQLQ